MIARALCCLLLALVGAGLGAASASAHATLVRTTPADTAVLRVQPQQVRLQFSEPVELGPNSLRLLDATGAQVKTAAPVHAGGSVALLPLPPRLARGTYVVAWRVTSADSHPVSGAFSFSVGAASSLVDTSATGSASRAVEVADAVGRGVSFLGFALLIGAACVLVLLWPGAASARGRRVIWVGAGASVVGTVAVLLLQGPYAAAEGLGGAFKPSLISFSLSTRFGHALVARLLLTLALCVVLAALLGDARGWLRARLGRRALLALAAACTVGLALTWTLTDHSRTGVQPGLGVPVASLHLLAMALWLGGLVLLVVCALARDESLPAGAIARFSRLALGCFAVLAASGVYLAWRQSGSLPALPATVFGRLLLIKTGAVLAIVALAFRSRRAVGRGGADLLARLRRTIGGEALLAVGVLGVTAALVNTAPARVAYAPPLNVTVAVPAGGRSPLTGGRIQVHMEPAKQGANVVDVYLVTRGGALFAAPELTARLLPPGDDVGPLPVKLASAEPGHYVADQLTVPYAGHWALRLEIRTSDVDETDVDVPVRIR